NPLSPREILEVSVVADGDEGDLGNKRSLARSLCLVLRACAVRLPPSAQRKRLQEVTAGAEVPHREPLIRNRQCKVGNVAAVTPLRAPVRRKPKVVDAKLCVKPPLLQTELLKIEGL